MFCWVGGCCLFEGVGSDPRIKGVMSAYHAMVKRLAKPSHDINRELSHFMRKRERGGDFPPLLKKIRYRRHFFRYGGYKQWEIFDFSG